MALTKEQIRAAAMELDPEERELLAEELLLTISTDGEPVDPAWLAELERREAEFAAGRMTAKPVEEVLDRLLKKAKP